MKATEINPATRLGVNGESRRATFNFEAVDVTGSHALEAEDVDRTSSAGAVARVLAESMTLPRNVPWTLRDERSGSYLDEDRPIGEQIEPGARVVVTPKAHLGMV